MANLPGRTRKGAGNGAAYTQGFFISKKKVRFRLMIAIPLFTTILVLALGLAIIYWNQPKLLSGDWTPASRIEYIDRIQEALGDTTIIIIIGAVIAAVTGIALALTITTPIRRLAVGTASIARGDLSRTIFVDGEGEIALLGSAFNEMISSINRYLIQSMSGGVITVNRNKVISTFSADAEIILGYPSNEAVGNPLETVFPDVPENAEFHDVINAVIDERTTVAGRRLVVFTRHRDGIPVSISTSLLKDREDTLIGIIVSFEDVEHLKKLEDQMKKVDRLTTLGGLAAGIAHQIRNPLCSIRGLAQLLKESGRSGSALSDYADVILKDADRISGVLDRLLRFLQPTASGWTMEGVNDLLRDALMLSRHEIKDREIEVIERYQPDVPRILVQSENLIQALVNVLINAFQAIEDSGSVTIETGTAADPGGGDGGFVRVRIADTGEGIAADDLERVFDPSFTTKDNGSGFGLVIARQVVESHDGFIKVTSEPDKETCFEIYLPVRRDQPREETRAEHAGTGS
ncbi:MAG: ATP-binding protein [bacterium]